MLGFDALGRLALGQGAQQSASTVILNANAGALASSGVAAAFKVGGALSAGSLALSEGAVVFRHVVVTTPAPYAVLGQSIQLRVGFASGSGAFALTGNASRQALTFASDHVGFTIDGQAVAMTVSGVLGSGGFTLAGENIGFGLIRESWIPVAEDSESWTEQLKLPEPWAIKARRRRR